MKKILVFLFMFLIALPCFAQDEFKSIVEFNGHDWMSWSQEAKSMFTLGFMTANEATKGFIYDHPEMPNEVKALYMMYFSIGKNNIEIVNVVDYYYITSGDLDTPIWVVIYVLYQRHWWDGESEEPELESVPEIDPEKDTNGEPDFNPPDYKDRPEFKDGYYQAAMKQL